MRNLFKRKSANRISGYYVRSMDSLEKWPDGGVVKYEGVVDNIQADIVTGGDIKTSDNDLSWWFVNDLNPDTMNLLAASVISAYNKKAAEKINFIVIPCSELKDFSLEESPEHAYTAIPALRSAHYDMRGLTYKKVGLLLHIMCLATSKGGGGFIRRIPYDIAFSTLCSVREKGEIDEDKLGDWIRKQLNKTASK